MTERPRAQFGCWAAVLLASCTLAVPALAGCSAGDDDERAREEFEQEILEARNALRSVLGGRGPGVRSRRAVVQTLREDATAIRAIADELEDVAVPEDAESATRELVDALEELAENLDDVAAAIPAAGRPTYHRLLDRLVELGRVVPVDRALAELRDAGFDAPPVREDLWPQP